MKERRPFQIISSSVDQSGDSIDLELGEKLSIPFTGAEIIYATTTSGEKVVVKKPKNNEQTMHEWEGLIKVDSAGVSVPRPIALIDYSAGQLSIVSGFVDGDNLYYNPNSEVKSEVGRQIKIMHQNVQIDGSAWESTGRSTFIYYDRYIFHWTAGELGELQADSKTVSLLGKFVDTTADFCKQAKPVFNHNDLHDGQIILDGNGNPTIIDFGNWIEETWLNEVGYHLFHLIRTGRMETDDFINFLSGYLGDKKLSDTERSNLAFYLLFISSRALNYFYRRHSSYLSTARETHAKVLNHLENEEIWKNY